MANQQNTLHLKYKLLTDKAKPLDHLLWPSEIGQKLYSAYDYTIPANERQIVKTDLSIIFPYGYYGQIAPLHRYEQRDPLSDYKKPAEKDIRVKNSVHRTFIYNESIDVTLYNHDKTAYFVKRGDPVAYLIINKKI
jgi:dUTP pyrophosphatase